MSRIYAEIELLNADDVACARKHIIGEEEIRKVVLNPLVDSGSDYLCINENIQAVLQLRRIGRKRLALANGKVITCDFVGDVELRFKNLRTICEAIVLPGDSDPLLGHIPLESLDVIIHPNRNELIENPDYH